MKEKVFLRIVSLFQLGRESQNKNSEEEKYRESIMKVLEILSKNDVACIFRLFREPQYRDYIRSVLLYINLVINSDFYISNKNEVKGVSFELIYYRFTEALIQDFVNEGGSRIGDVRAVSYCLNEIFHSILRYNNRLFSEKNNNSESYIQCKLIDNYKTITNRDNYKTDTDDYKFNINDFFNSLKSLYFRNGYVPFSNDFNKKKKEYELLLKEDNKKAHVYLLGELNIDKFYIRPKLNTGFTFLSDSIYGPMINKNHLSEATNEFIGKNSTTIHSFFYKSIMNSLSINLTKDCHWNEIFKDNNVIYLIGGPGYGKTLFLKNLVSHFDELKIFDSEEYLVIYADCKDYEYILNGQNCSFVENLCHIVRWYYPIEFDSIKGMLNYYIARGRCMILFDALDEVNSERRDNVHKSILNAVRHINPSNLVCIVSRERGFVSDKSKTIYHIPPLKQNDITLYIERMVALKKFKKGEVENFLTQARPLMEQGLLNSFLILSLLVNIYNGENSLPETKLELYQKCYDYIFIKREDKIYKSKDYQEKGLLEEKRKTLKSIMRPNTFYELARMCTPSNNDISRDKIEAELVPIYSNTYGNANEALYAVELFLKFCSERTELFVLSGTYSNDEMVSDQYRFFHRAFCEYFYSQYIYTRENLPHKIYHQLAILSEDSEVYELLLNTLKNQKQDIYEGLLLLILEKIESGSTVERKKAVTIFSICFTSITEENFRNRFICFLRNSAEWVAKNITCIIYQEEIAAYICSAREYEGRGWNKKEISSAYKVFHQINILTVFIKQYPQAIELIHGNLELEKYEKKIIEAGRTRFLKYFYDIVCDEQEGIKSFLKELNIYNVNSLLKYSKIDNESTAKNTKYATMLGLKRSDIEKLKKDYKYFFEHTNTGDREALAGLYDCE